MKKQTAVSLFAGIGAFDLALENNGVDVVASAEIDKYARAVLTEKFPNTKLLGDVMEVTGDELISAGFVPDGGIITGGFPCQDLSVAGKRLGFTGWRSSLFYHIARIADETKTQWLILENVPGLLNSQRGADMGAVVGTLVELGYCVSWRVLDAQNFGVPQRRRRVFIVAERSGDPTGATEVLFKPSSLRGNIAPSKKTGEDPAGEAPQGPGNPIAYSRAGYGEYTEGVMPLMATMHKRPDAYIIVDEANTVYDISNRTDAVRIYQDKAMTLPARMGTGDNNVPVKLQMADTDVIRKLTPEECEALMGFPRGWTDNGQSNLNRYKQLGNSIVVPVADWIVKGIVERNARGADPVSSSVISS